MLPLYAELQRGEAAHAMDHIDHGVPELCAELAACRVPATIQHDDLHHVNLYVREGSYVFWTGATPRSRTGSRPSSLRSASSRSAPGFFPKTLGSHGCGTPTWSRGVPISRPSSRWPSVLGASPGRSRTYACERRYRSGTVPHFELNFATLLRQALAVISEEDQRGGPSVLRLSAR